MNSDSNADQRSRLWRLTAIVFTSSACMMILELVAGPRAGVRVAFS